MFIVSNKHLYLNRNKMKEEAWRRRLHPSFILMTDDVIDAD
jgi:hypothetical protein